MIRRETSQVTGALFIILLILNQISETEDLTFLDIKFFLKKIL